MRSDEPVIALPLLESHGPPPRGLRRSQPPPELTGPALWRSLDEWARAPAFREWLAREFPAGALDGVDEMNRRGFLKLMAASFALAGVGACATRPGEQIVPYVRNDLAAPQGEPLHFASTLTRGGYGCGVVVESRMGRPIKIEGNPDHPASLGASDVFMQAELLTLYDPDRSQAVRRGGRVSTWTHFQQALAERLAAERDVRLLTGRVTSPTTLRLIERFVERYPQTRWHAYEPIDDDNARQGAASAFGRPAELVYDFANADAILSVDCDFLFALPGSLRYAREFGARRRLVLGGEQSADTSPGAAIDTGAARDAATAEMNRLYVIETTPTITGAKADHRLAVRRGRIETLVRALASEVGAGGAAGSATRQANPPELPEPQRRWIRAVADDLRARGSRALVLVGAAQPAAVHALAHAINARLGALGTTVRAIEPVAGGPKPAGLRELTDAMHAGRVGTLLLLGVNPVYDTPADLGFAAALRRVGLSAHVGLYQDETAQASDWHVPLAHELESWGDARAFDGTASLIQPLIEPMYRGRTVNELLDAFVSPAGRTGLDIVREHWREHYGRVVGGGDFDAWWRTCLQAGVVPDTRWPILPAPADAAEALGGASPADRGARREPDEPRAAATQPDTASDEGVEVELALSYDSRVWDGRYANNGWLQELPKPLSKLTWDNAAYVAPATAARLGLANGDRVELRLRGAALACAVWLLPGQAEDAVTLTLGYGRPAAGRVGRGLGFNAYALRYADAPWFAAGARLRRLPGRHELATTQEHHTMAGREPLRHGTLEAFRRDPQAVGRRPSAYPQASLYPEYAYEGRKWGMVIDLTACIGCGACTIACQAENNIPIVGAREVRRGREMHWIRVDRYFAGPAESPEVYFSPVPCMHCEKAPCEIVCPVGATKHSGDGLNEMVYNRCIGTRYCSNNCPYKVRRFNFLTYTAFEPETLKLMRNPDVTVRGRGVMEKCTYCVQRIRRAEIAARLAGEPLATDSFTTACAQACPTQAIVFGDLNDRRSRVAHLRDQPHNYGLLAHLNTQPRTTYLPAIRNPNPALDGISDRPAASAS